jgi:acid stress chaperone HdeA
MSPWSLLAPASSCVLVAGLLVGCGGNDGGDTRCEDFALMSEGQREDVVRALLTEDGGPDPSDGTVTLTVTAASYHCLSPEAADDLVRDVLG